LIASVALGIITLGLNPSIGGPGPHAFASAREAFVHAQRALSLLTSTAPRFQRP